MACAICPLMSKWTRKLKSTIAGNPAAWRLVKKAQEVKYDYQYFRFHGPYSGSLASTKEINLEFSSACNLRCRFCALDHLKPKSYMSTKVLDKVMESLLHDPRFSRVKTLNLHNGGETLMHPRRVELFERLAHYKKIFHLKNKAYPRVILLTNGMLLREKLSRTLLSLHTLDEVGFSLDGGSPEAFEEMRVNARWEKFAANVEHFIRLKNELSPKVRTFGISIVPHPHPLNDSWMAPDFQRIARMLDSVEYRRLHDWGGQVDIGEQQEVNKKGCEMLLRQLVVLPDGAVTVCCNDLNKKGVVGNVLETDLFDLYRGQERMRYVHLLKEGRKAELELCKDCASF